MDELSANKAQQHAEAARLILPTNQRFFEVIKMA
jgi:hypothetical protein